MCQPPSKEESMTSSNNNERPYENKTSLRYPQSTHPIEDLPTLDPSHVPYRIAANYILNELEKHDICAPTVGIM
jgi:hypothetical protein